MNEPKPIESETRGGSCAPATCSAWFAVSDACLPPLGIPVWLYMPEVRQPMIGCRTEDDGAWYWARCYDDFWFDGQWKTSTAEMDDLKPSHWMPLPLPPNASHQAPAALDAANTTDATSRLPACAGSPSNDKPSTTNQ